MPNTNQVTPALPMRDMRSESNEWKRSKSHAVKWSRGGRSAPGKYCVHRKDFYGPACSECAARPYSTATDLPSRLNRNEIYANSHAHRQENIAKKGLQKDAKEAAVSGDSESSDYDSDVSAEVAQIMFSYDARGPPSDGADILNRAVVQAVQRFENKQIEQLIKKEYDTVPDRREFERHECMDVAEDEYDFVDVKDLE